MSKAWPLVKLGEVISQRKEFITIDDTQEYMRCRVQLHAKGIVLRDRVTGSEIKTKQQQVCRAGEFLVAEIDAKVGGFGIVPDELENSIVSSHYFLFTIDSAKLNKKFLDYYSKTPTFREQVNAKGSTNYAAIRPQEVLNYTITLPPLAEQQRIVAKIKRLAGKIEEARELRSKSVQESKSIILSKRNKLFTNLSQKIKSRFLSSVSDSRLGKMLSQNQAQDNDGTPYIRNANVQWGYLDLSDIYRMHVTEEEKEKFSLQSGDILICEGGDIGKAAIWNDEVTGCIYQKALHRLRVDPTLIKPKFMLNHIFWAAEQGHFTELKTQTTIAHLTGVKLKTYPVFIPPIEEQCSIIREIDSLQTKINYIKNIQTQTTAELDAMLPSILDKAFRGEL